MKEGKTMRVTTTDTKQKNWTKEDLAKAIDHTVLKPTAIDKDIDNGARIAIEHNLRAFVVEPHYAAYVIRKKLLENTNVLCASVCDFPKAGSTTDMRVIAIKELLKLGVDEIDIVSKFYLLLEKNYSEFNRDIKAVTQAMRGKTLKIILECDYLDESQIRKAVSIICEVAKEEKAKNLIVKTNTGFAEGEVSKPRLLNIDTVRYIRETLEEHSLYAENIEDIAQGKIGIKASARIKTKDDAIPLLDKGVHILGTSSGDKIIAGY